MRQQTSEQRRTRSSLQQPEQQRQRQRGDDDRIEHIFADIMDCAVIGIEDEMLGNKICVYAVARKNISLLDIRKHLEEAGIAMFKLPDVLRLVKRIPVTAMKKVDKEALRILEKEHYE